MSSFWVSFWEDSSCLGAVQEILEELGSLDNGFAVLKAAITILNRHYPGIVGRVFYLNSVRSSVSSTDGLVGLQGHGVLGRLQDLLALDLGSGLHRLQVPRPGP